MPAALGRFYLTRFTLGLRALCCQRENWSSTAAVWNRITSTYLPFTGCWHLSCREGLTGMRAKG
jgi:hypothetical protein